MKKADDMQPEYTTVLPVHPSIVDLFWSTIVFTVFLLVAQGTRHLCDAFGWCRPLDRESQAFLGLVYVGWAVVLFVGAVRVLNIGFAGH